MEVAGWCAISIGANPFIPPFVIIEQGGVLLTLAGVGPTPHLPVQMAQCPKKRRGAIEINQKQFCATWNARSRTLWRARKWESMLGVVTEHLIDFQWCTNMSMSFGPI